MKGETQALARLCGHCGLVPVVDNSRVCLACQDDDEALVAAVYGESEGENAMKIEELLEAFRALATGIFDRCIPEEQTRAEQVAHEIVSRANEEGLPAVVGTMIAAADMMERVALAMRT